MPFHRPELPPLPGSSVRADRASLGFVQNLDSGDGRIVHNWFKGKIQLPLRIGFQVTIGFRVLVEASGFPEDIEVVQKRLPITHNLENPAMYSRGCGGEIELGKVEDKSVGAPRIYRNRIGEMPISLSGKEVRVRRIHKRMSPVGQMAVHEIVIRIPDLALAVS